MNPTPERLTEVDLARIVVNDTIRSAHTKPDLIKDATVEDCLDALKAPESGRIVQSLLAEYTASEIAALNSDSIAMFDSRLLNAGAVRISAAVLKDELIHQLTGYLELPADEKAIIVQGLLSE